MSTFNDLIATDSAIFLRDHTRSDVLYRLPPAPQPLRLSEDAVALYFTKYRYALNDPAFDTVGGAVLLTVLDFGTLPAVDAKAQTQLPSVCLVASRPTSASADQPGRS
jgi:hypothetical protein